MKSKDIKWCPQHGYPLPCYKCGMPLSHVSQGELLEEGRRNGIKEVVEWLQNNSPTIQIGQDIAATATGFCGKIGDATYYPKIKLFDWQDKLKEWGLGGVYEENTEKL